MRDLPPQYKHMMTIETFRKLGFWERCKIFMGYNIKVSSIVYMEWKPGRYHPLVGVMVTDQAEPGPAAQEGVDIGRKPEVKNVQNQP